MTEQEKLDAMLRQNPNNSEIAVAPAEIAEPEPSAVVAEEISSTPEAVMLADSPEVEAQRQAIRTELELPAETPVETPIPATPVTETPPQIQGGPEDLGGLDKASIDELLKMASFNDPGIEVPEDTTVPVQEQPDLTIHSEVNEDEIDKDLGIKLEKAGEKVDSERESNQQAVAIENLNDSAKNNLEDARRRLEQEELVSVDTPVPITRIVEEPQEVPEPAPVVEQPVVAPAEVVAQAPENKESNTQAVVNQMAEFGKLEQKYKTEVPGIIRRAAQWLFPEATGRFDARRAAKKALEESMYLTQMNARYESLQNQSSTLQIELAQVQSKIQELDKENILPTEKDKLKTDLDLKQDYLEKSIDSVNKEVDALIAQREKTLAALKEFEYQRDKAVIDVVSKYDEKIGPREEQLDSLDDEKKLVEENIAEIKRELAEYKKDRDELANGPHTKKSLKILNKEVAAVESRLSDEYKRLGKMNARIIPLRGELNQWKRDRRQYSGLGEREKTEDLTVDTENLQVHTENFEEDKKENNSKSQPIELEDTSTAPPSESPEEESTPVEAPVSTTSTPEVAPQAPAPQASGNLEVNTNPPEPVAITPEQPAPAPVPVAEAVPTNPAPEVRQEAPRVEGEVGPESEVGAKKERIVIPPMQLKEYIGKWNLFVDKNKIKKLRIKSVSTDLMTEIDKRLRDDGKKINKEKMKFGNFRSFLLAYMREKRISPPENFRKNMSNFQKSLIPKTEPQIQTQSEQI